MKTTTIFTTLVLGSFVLACDGGTEAPADDKTAKAEPSEAEPEKEPEAEAAPEEKPEEAAPAGDATPYLANAIDTLASGGACDPNDTSPYGCSVKYGDGEGDATAEIGQPAPDFELKDLEGNPVKLADYKGKTVVLEWFNPGCPFVKYAHGEGPLKSMAKDSMAKNGELVWLAINSGAPGKQGTGLDTNKAAASEWAMEHPVLLDEDGKVGRAYGAKTTPHVFVVDKEGKLAYRGGVDDAPLGERRG